MDDTQENRAAFMTVMQALADNFGAEMSIPGVEMRFMALREFSMPQIQAMAMSLLRSRKYSKMPTVAEMLEHLGAGAVSVEDRAELEAAKVLRAIESVGGYRSVVFDDPVTQAVIQGTYGGWDRLCSESTQDQERFFRPQFVRAYCSYNRQGVRVFGSLPGRTEITNAASGRSHQDRVAFVGDYQKALGVLNAGSNRDRAILGNRGPVSIQSGMDAHFRSALDGMEAGRE